MHSLSILRAIDDHGEFASLPAHAQHSVQVALSWMLKIEQAGHGAKGQIVRAAAAALGCTESTVNRHLKAFRSRGWRGLVDGRVTAGGEKSLPAPAQDFIRSLHLAQQRDTSGHEVRRQLLERWERWRRTGDPQHAIPGYAVPPRPGPKGYPEGWSIDTIRRLRPEAYALRTARQGEKSAAKLLPSIMKTRFGTRFGQLVFFDDQDYDLKVVAPGSSQRTLRPQGFACIDYLSGCFMHHVSRLRWWDEAREQYRTLTKQDATWFVIAYLQLHGYRTDEAGTQLFMEHGTMDVFRNKDLSTYEGHSSFDDAISALTGGHCTVQRGGLFNGPAFAEMLFRPQSSGNPNCKAPIESMFNLVRNRMAALPGPTGLDFRHAPAEQYGLDLYSAQLLRLHERLPEHLQDLIRYPVLTASQFGQIEMATYAAINARTDHALEGWADCGHVVPQIRFTPDERSPWISQAELAALPEATQALALSLIEQPGFSRLAPLAPIHVAEAHRHELTRLADHAVPLLIPRQWARTVEVRSDRTVAIQDQLLGREALTYVARLETKTGAEVLRPGLKLQAFLNPFLPDKLIVCREDGAFIGALSRIHRAHVADHEAILGQLKQRAELKSDLDTAVRPHLQPLARQRAEDTRHNERLAQGLPVTPEDMRDARSASARQSHKVSFGRAVAAENARLAAETQNPEPEAEDWSDAPYDAPPIHPPAPNHNPEPEAW